MRATCARDVCVCARARGSRNAKAAAAIHKTDTAAIWTILALMQAAPALPALPPRPGRTTRAHARQRRSSRQTAAERTPTDRQTRSRKP